MAVEHRRRDSKTCLDAREVELLAAGRMPSADLPAAMNHVAFCEGCRVALRSAGYDELTATSPHVRSADTGTTKEQRVDIRPQAGNSDPAGYPFLRPPEAPGELGRLGHYRILRLLGSGGMGTVFEAEDSLLHRRVAIKVLRPQGLDESSRQRFMQEAQLAASLHSDRIVTIYQVGEDHGSLYIAMELLAGESLETRLKREPRLPVSQALRIAREVAEGLAVAHEKGLVHRDIKPPNVWLERLKVDDSVFRVKLLDFGIARQIKSESRLTEEGMIVGTPSYMCPEQACGLPMDERSDLFSLGCLLYAMLAGDSPFKRSNTMLSIRAVAEEEAQPIREKVPDVSPQVALLLQRLLNKHPTDRPASASLVADEIRALESSLKPADHVSPAVWPTLPTALRGQSTETRSRLPKLGRGGIAGVAAVVFAALVGLWVQIHRVANTPEPATLRDQTASQSSAANAARDIPADKPNAGPAVVGAAAGLPPIKVGILHSFTGPMGASERPIADATLLAIEEINAAGGVLGGREIQPITKDGKSFDDVFSQQAVELVAHERVATLFGVWRSGCRKAVEEVCEKYDNLLVYPRGYEGLEQSPNVIYMGGAPNQQITPAIRWAYADLRKRKFFLIGTEGVFSCSANEMVKDEVAVLGASVVGEVYRRLDDSDFTATVEKLKRSGADVVVNSVSGTGNIGLFEALRKAGIKPGQVPVISYDVSEEELRMLSGRPDDLIGDYGCWSYFESLPGKANRDFIERFRKRFGPKRTINDPMAAAYAGVYLWALGVNAAKGDRPADIRRSMVLQRFDAPEGPVSIDPKNQHAIRMARIGEVVQNLEFEVVWTSPKPIMPEPFPPTRSRQAWEQFTESLRQRWGGKWSPDSEATSSQP